MDRNYEKWSWGFLDESPEGKKWIRNLPGEYLQTLSREYLSLLFEEDIPIEYDIKLRRSYMVMMREIDGRRERAELNRRLLAWSAVGIAVLGCSVMILNTIKSW